MKRFLLSVVLATTLALSSCQFDDSALWSKLDEYGESIRDHEERISALEELCKQMNTNIEALQTLVDALEKRDYVTNVAPIREDGKVVGYTISFAYSDTITIYNGKDGQDGANGADGKDGYTPQIGVMKDTDGIYYWTLDGKWLTDVNGDKIKAIGVDGEDGKDGVNGEDGQDGKDGANGKDGQDGTNGSDGKDGQDGTNGTDGKDGITPQLKIENDYWYVSYDNGATWVQLGKATGEDGEDGKNGDSGVIINVEESETEVVFTLADGSTITLPKGEKADVVSENNKIYYTTTDGKRMFPTYTEPSYFGAMLVSNTYEDGQGVLTFDGPVTSIGSYVFQNCNSLTSVTIGNSVTSIGESAFHTCTSLTSVTIGNSVTSIGAEAFGECSSLTSVTIGNSVTSIGVSAFQGCDSLTTITIPDSVTSIEEAAFGWCLSLKAFYGNFASSDNCCLIVNGIFNSFAIGCGATEYTIPDGVTSIGGAAFSGCDSLTSITIPDSVTSIGMSAFWGCTSLTSVTIPDSVTWIEAWAFRNCSSLKSVYCKPTTPPTTSSWGDWDAFYNNAYGRKIYVPRNLVEAYKAAWPWSNYANYIEGYDF